MIPFQIVFRHSRLPTNMATVAKYIKGGMQVYFFLSDTTGPVGSKIC